MRRLRDPREGKQHLQPSPGGRARVYTHTHRPADPLPRPLAEPTCPVSGSLPAGHIPPTRAGLHEGRRELPHLLCRHRLTPPPPPIPTTGPTPGCLRRLEASPRSPWWTVSSGDKCPVPAQLPHSRSLWGPRGPVPASAPLLCADCPDPPRLRAAESSPAGVPEAGELTGVPSGGTVLGHRAGCGEFSYEAISVLPMIDASLMGVRSCSFPPALPSFLLQGIYEF